MRIAKPILLITTPLGVLWGLYEAYRFSPGLAVLMGALVAFMTVAAASVIRTVRREHREQGERGNAASE
jgi:uncharacterized membrane-anchored protein